MRLIIFSGVLIALALFYLWDSWRYARKGLDNLGSPPERDCSRRLNMNYPRSREAIRREMVYRQCKIQDRHCDH